MRHHKPRALRRVVPVLAPLCAALVIAGCSSGGRFGGPSWNLTGGKGATPLPTQPIHRQPQAAGDPIAGLNAGQMPVYRGGRDPVTGRATALGAAVQPSLQQQQPQAVPLAPARGTQAAASQLIEVRPGQSLAMIAGEHRVSIAALMHANGLRDPYVIPGQQLVIPQR